jgi:RNA polymerase sigma-70 factor (ECF subfamily)
MYDAYAPRIYRFLYRRLGDAYLAEDLTGDVFLRALAALRNGRFAADDLAPWLFRIARNRMIDHFRRTPPGGVETWDDRFGDQIEEVGAALEEAMNAEWLRYALTLLSPEQKTVIALRFDEGLSAIEVADKLGSSAQAVRAMQYRALTALRRLFFDSSPNPLSWST